MTLSEVGYTVEMALEAEHQLARAFGCVAEDGRRWRASYWDRSAEPEFLESDNLALRNAARVLVSEKRSPWERIALAQKILRRYGAPS